jgi:hypothetical protein
MTSYEVNNCWRVLVLFTEKLHALVSYWFVFEVVLFTGCKKKQVINKNDVTTVMEEAHTFHAVVLAAVLIYI